MARNHVSGYIVNQDNISVNNMQYADNASVWDINGYVMVKKSELEGFNSEGSGKKDRLDKALSLIGASEVSRTILKKPTKAGAIQKEEKFVIIPVTRTIDSKIYTDSEINTFADKVSLSASTAAKR
jgi:hypothetical protein